MSRFELESALPSDPVELIRLHDELDRLTPARSVPERIRDGVIVTAAAWASWMILGTAANLGVVWPFAVALGVGWTVSLGIGVARRMRIRDLRRRIRDAEGLEEPGQVTSG